MADVQQEEWCRDEFDRWLRAEHAHASIQWEPGSDPPDFWLTFNRRRFAVEVTRLVDRDETTVTAWLWREVNKIEQRLRTAGGLHGTYRVSFDSDPAEYRAPSPAQRRDLRTRLSTFLEDYIRRTAGSEKEPERATTLGPAVQCRISKVSPEDHMIGSAGPNGAGGWEDDVQRQVAPLLANALKQKASLARSYPAVVLILHDEYLCAAQGLLRECAQSMPETREFHTIYVVRGSGPWPTAETSEQSGPAAVCVRKALALEAHPARGAWLSGRSTRRIGRSTSSCISCTA
jgi:hypothetical protein